MKRYLSFLMGILGFVPILAQQSDYYYYYKGERIDLTVDSTRLFVVSEGEFQPQETTRTSTAGYNIGKSSKSYVYSNVVPLQKKRTATPEVYFTTLDVPVGTDASQYDVLVSRVEAEKDVWQVLPSFTANGNRMDVTNNFYVKLKSADDFGKLQQMATQYGFEIIGNNEFMPLWYTLSCNAKSSQNAIEAANTFYSSGEFECSEPEIRSYNNLQSTDDVPNDEFYEYQWALHNYDYPGMDINVGGAWSIAKGEGVVVAIIDDGIYSGHGDLRNNMHPLSYDAMTGESPSGRYELHGTYCAGVLGAIQNNNIGISGVAPNCELMSVSLDFYNGSTTQQAANAILWACNKGADVMSCSWGYDTPCDILSDAVDSVLIHGRGGKGCVLVFSAGNTNTQDLDHAIKFPANSNPNIVVAGASKPCGERVGDSDSLCCAESLIFWASCYGEELDVVAPRIYITTTTSSVEHWTEVIHNFGGTSAACPHVAGVAALMLSVNPDMPVETAEYIIGKTARKARTDVYSYQKNTTHKHGTWNEKVGYGLLDATAAVEMAKRSATANYVWNRRIDGYVGFEFSRVDVEDVTFEPGAELFFFECPRVLFKSSVQIKKGVKASIYGKLEE